MAMIVECLLVVYESCLETSEHSFDTKYYDLRCNGKFHLVVHSYAVYT